MNAQHFRRLFAYNQWAHARVWECVLALSDEQFKRPSDYSVGSVHQQIVHTLEAEWLWFNRVRGTSSPALAPAETYPTLPEIRARWDDILAAWATYADALTDDALLGTISFIALKDKQTHTMPLWEGLMQILNHSTDHRAQTLALIHRVGGKTLEQDFAFFSWAYPAESH